MRGIVSELLKKYEVFAFFSAERAKLDFRKAYQASLKRVRSLLNGRKLVLAEQVHGASVAIVRRGKSVYRNVDALVSRNKGFALGIVTADCFPIMLYDFENEVFAAVHSGWRGTYKNILGRVVKRFLNPSTTIASIGPGICHNCYEVGKDLYVSFQHRFRGVEIGRENHLDLRALLNYQLRQTGVLPANIENIDLCTCENQEFLYSYRCGDKNYRNINIIYPH